MKEKSYNNVSRDLTWYFNRSSSEAFHFSSSFGAFVMSCWQVSVHNANPDTMTDAQLSKVSKFRRIHNILISLPSDTQRALASIYDWEVINKYPLTATRFYGHKTGLLFFTTYFDDIKHLEEFLKRRLQSKLSAQEQVISFKMGQEIDKLYNTIHEQYQEAAGM